MGKVNRNKKQNYHDSRVDQNRSERMNIANPAATQTLYIKFFEETHSGADKNGVQRGEDCRPPGGAARQPRKQRKNRNSQQDRRELPASGDREPGERESHGRPTVTAIADERTVRNRRGSASAPLPGSVRS